ncbi:helix-turn-helix domain-containing protein [Nocardia sp. NBC_00403]|uniref:helix-turn-helix domain-containing protein n=1 Tax=Nocardia sp. NBC_00403 TaxID=2975990 RepID=UPI002E1D5534
MKRTVGYTWRLREVMAVQRVFTATELVQLLHERGINLSASQVHRLVSGTPERLSLQVLSALCDILACTPADLVVTSAENAGVRRTGTADTTAQPPVVAKLRPRPARILAEE